MKSKALFEAFNYVDDTYLDMVDTFEKENNSMGKQKKTIHLRRTTSLIFAACLIFALATTAYAADIGGIQRIIQIWIRGDQTTAVLNIQNGQYTLTNADGSLIKDGGGVAFEPDGSERPLTEEEVVEHLDQPELWYGEDDTIQLYYHGQEIEITDNMFDADGYCYLELRDGDNVLYVTIEKSGGMATSPLSYVQPDKFGTSSK
ncbi:MAG: hypothetical protein IKB09_07935 [Oscillospiraceae bacterium]|nr:hypothetical protein [Oscillospiraceae bacterium]